MVEAVIEIESKTYKWDKWTHPNNKSDEVADPVCGETLSIYQNEKNLSMEFLEYRTLKTSEMRFYDFSYPRITSTVKEVELDYFGSKEYKIEEYPCVLENALNDKYFQGRIKDMNIKEEIPIIMGIFTPPINNMIESLKNEDSTFRRENQKRYLRELRKKAIERASKEYARSVTDANKAFLNGVKRLTREIPTPVGNNND